jgi:hypothetical protein
MVDLERWKITAETTAIRGRGWVRSAVRLVGLVLVIAGGVNLLLVDAVLPVGVYRETWVALAGIPAWPLGDFIAIGAGAAVAWFV